MYNYSLIQELTVSALSTIQNKDSEEIVAAYKKLDETFLKEFPGREYAYSYESLYARMQMIASFIEYNIFISNLDGIRDNLQDLADLQEFAKHQPYSGEQMSKIRWCVKNAIKRVDDLMYEHLHPDPAQYDTDYIDGLPVENGPQRIKPKAAPTRHCLVCETRDDLRKGSHLAPNTLIQKFFSVDGSATRGKEISQEFVAAELKDQRSWGNAVLPEQIDETFGETLSEEEKTNVLPNPLTRDNIFCDYCEHRFGYIEAAYGDYFHGRKKSVDSAVSYLFWISVFWRLSVADMCVRLSVEDEEKMRQMLDLNLPATAKDISKLKPNDSLQGFKYCIYHCENIKGEVTGLIGNHASHPPYRLIVGNYVVVMYPDNYDDGIVRAYNDYTHPEQIVEESFLDFWKHKRSILDEVNAVESQDLNDESANITDVVKGNDAWEWKTLIPEPVNKFTLDDLKEEGEVGVITTPGAVMRMLAWTKNHMDLSIVEQCKGIKEELGYTYEESEYFYKWNATHNRVDKMRVRK